MRELIDHLAGKRAIRFFPLNMKPVVTQYDINRIFLLDQFNILIVHAK
ncbi:hypothetical protein SDC9_174956 [bioreactor metagenome]|uniref:Uncharacterized protein n=1 Tax=bioreactor metagenome TaxID=1076179 RepID=A0A645GNP7_9ZZZZ